jgi:hypothetical protein
MIVGTGGEKRNFLVKKLPRTWGRSLAVSSERPHVLARPHGPTHLAHGQRRAIYLR